LFAAAAHFIFELSAFDQRIQTRGAFEAIRMRLYGAPDQIVFGAIVLDDGKWNYQRAIDAVPVHVPQQLFGHAGPTAVPRAASMSVRIENAKARFHSEADCQGAPGSADTIRSVI
jgi:hypothetical protein